MRWCGRGDSNPHRPFGPTDFLTSYGFRRRPLGVCGLDYPFTCSESPLGAARLVSTPSPFRGLARDCHVTGFPEFEQFCIRGFPRSTQVRLSPLRLPISPRPLSLFFTSLVATANPVMREQSVHPQKPRGS